MKTALITIHARRPQYSERVLKALEPQVMRNPDIALHIAGFEPTMPQREVLWEMVIRSFAGLSHLLVGNILPAHVNNNVRSVLTAFLETDCEWFLYFEDDTLPSKGAVDFMLRALREHSGNPDFEGVSLVADPDGVEPTQENLDAMEVHRGSSGLWGYGGTRRTAKRILLSIPELDEELVRIAKTNHSYVWDLAYERFRREMRKTTGLYTITPRVNRVQNIGELDGCHRGGHTYRTWEGA